jgi:hypothetical protein
MPDMRGRTRKYNSDARVRAYNRLYNDVVTVADHRAITFGQLRRAISLGTRVKYVWFREVTEEHIAKFAGYMDARADAAMLVTIPHSLDHLHVHRITGRDDCIELILVGEREQ